jgi:hypothetical protein
VSDRGSRIADHGIGLSVIGYAVGGSSVLRFFGFSVFSRCAPTCGSFFAAHTTNLEPFEMKTNLKLVAALTVGLLGGAAIAHAAQPHMEAAMERLKGARAELESAEADKGGHRGRAIGLVDQAIEETKQGIEFGRH